MRRQCVSFNIMRRSWRLATGDHRPQIIMNRAHLNVCAKSIFSLASNTKMLSILVVLYLTVTASGHPCLEQESVDITNGTRLKDGFIQYGEDIFPPKYVFSTFENGQTKTFGCLCKLRKCFRKCCPLGSLFYNKTCTNLPLLDSIDKDGLPLYDGRTLRGQKTLAAAGFGLLVGKPYSGCYIEDIFFIQEVNALIILILWSSNAISRQNQFHILIFLGVRLAHMFLK